MRKGKIGFLRTAGLITALCMLLAGCSGRRGEVSIRIVATTDVHGSIFDKDLMDGSDRNGSLAKLSTFLNRERKENRNVIYLDAGDVLQGSVEMYHDVTAQFERESLAASAYGLLGCEAVTFGNHELAVGMTAFESFRYYAPFPVLGVNVCFDDYGDFLDSYTMIERGGVKVAVLGMTTPVVNYSVASDTKGELEVRDIVETARFAVPILRKQKGADVVVALVHSGLEGGRMDSEGVYEDEVSMLAAQVPGLDLIIYGHDHEPACLKLAGPDGDSVLVINPGPYAQKAAVATVNVDFRGSDKPKVLTSGYLQDITVEEPDKAFMKKLSGWYGDVKAYCDSVVGSVNIPLEGKGALWRGSSAMDYVHSIQLGFQGAEISLTSPVFAGTYIPAGNITMRDLFKVYRFDNTMVSVNLRGSEVRDILEYSTSLYYNTVKKGTDHLLKLRAPDADGVRMTETPSNYFITAAGIDYEVDVTKPAGERVRILSMSDGKPFDPNRMYRTTINSFLYGGTESALFAGGVLKHKDMPGRCNLSSAADIRYFMITQMAFSDDRRVNVNTFSNWRLVPERLVSECLAKDTIDFSIIKERTR